MRRTHKKLKSFAIGVFIFLIVCFVFAFVAYRHQKCVEAYESDGYSFQEANDRCSLEYE